MKKIIAIVLCIALCLSDMTFVMAENEQEEMYYTINAEFSDKVGQIEQVQVMVKDNHVYANAEELAGRLGYQVASNEEYVLVYNQDNEEIPYGFTQFYINDTRVTHTLFTEFISSYEAPFATIKNDKGDWIPLEYSLLILNSGMMIGDKGILVDMPQKDIVDICLDIVRNNDHYTFQWAEDFGYSIGDVYEIGISSHFVNLFNGILKFDDDSWAQLFNHMELENTYYNKEYGKDLAMLICTQSSKELNEIIEEVENVQNLLSEDGQLGEILSEYSKDLDKDVGTLYEECEEILEKVKRGNTDVVEYNRSYQALEDALDKQAWFSDLGGDVVMQVQSEITGALTLLEIGTKIAEIVKYGAEFQNQDEFAVQALLKYLEDTKEQAAVSRDTSLSMIEYSKQLQENVVAYSVKRWWDENIDEIIGEAIGESLSMQANAILIAWDLASNYIPVLSGGISGAEKFELALYGTALQYGAFDNSRNYRVRILSEEIDITPENLYQLSQYYYVYLKSCYITREAAIGSLAGKLEIGSNREKIQPLIDYQNAINTDIAEMLVKLKEAETTNEQLIYGFLPQNNKKYLKTYNDLKLIEKIKEQNVVEINDNKYTEDNDVSDRGIEERIESETGLTCLWFVEGDFDKGENKEIYAFVCTSATDYSNGQLWYFTISKGYCLFYFGIEQAKLFYNVVKYMPNEMAVQLIDIMDNVDELIEDIKQRYF